MFTHHDRDHTMTHRLRADNTTLDALKARAGITHDRQLAEAMGITAQSMSRIRKGSFPGEKFQTWVRARFGEVPGLYVLEDTTGENR